MNKKKPLIKIKITKVKKISQTTRRKRQSDIKAYEKNEQRKETLNTYRALKTRLDKDGITNIKLHIRNNQLYIEKTD